MTRRRAITVAFASFALGCGLVSGLDVLQVDDAGVATDSAADSGSDALITCDAGIACGTPVPPGFTPLLFTSTTATCPDGTVPADGVADPTVSPDACSCRCTMTTKGTCSAAIVDLFIGDSGLGSCNTIDTVLSGTPGCHTTDLSIAANSRLDSSGAGTIVDAGACSNSAVSDASSLQATQVRACVPSSCAAIGSLCGASSQQRLCVGANGDVACPAPFSEKHSAGASASLACSTCGSSCTIGTQTCSSGKLTLYTDGACSIGGQGVSSCFSIGALPLNAKSYAYAMTAQGTCTTTETSTASTKLAQQTTICCQPEK